jgi:hypothetical protein
MPKKPLSEFLNISNRSGGPVPKIELPLSSSTFTVIVEFNPEVNNTGSLELLRQEGYIEGIKRLEKLDSFGSGSGEFYYQILLNTEQVLEFIANNENLQLVEELGVRSVALEDMPSWSKRPNGAPAHVFWGNPIKSRT